MKNFCFANSDLRWLCWEHPVW